MKSESIIFAVAGMCFGLILGWVLAVQQGGSRSAVAPATASASGSATAANTRQPPALNEARVEALTKVLADDPKNAGAAVDLGNVYFDAERYEDAIKWYQQALNVDPKNADASTDLGVSYYYSGQTDKALEQFETSLRINPKHTKTLLNQGIVFAFGKQDLTRAAEAWKRVVELAPDSAEGRAASRALEGVAAAGHPGGGATPAPPTN